MPNDIDNIETLKGKVAVLLKENSNLKDELDDLKILNENTMEHSSALEEELVEHNLKVELLQKKMKKYLSPQLYDSLVGGQSDATLAHTRKKLTVFFSDIVGFTEITDSVESELLSEILNNYLNRMADIAIKWGGTIDKFIGDAVMVFFGDPEFIDDQTHARNCVSMALEMIAELKKLAQIWVQKGITQTLSIRIGVNSGYCTVGNFGSESRMDYTIIGGNVNIASRLETLAKPNSIYISGATNNLVKDVFRTQLIGNVNVKGVHHPIEVFEVIGPIGEAEDDGKEILRLTEKGFNLETIECDLKDMSSAEKEKIAASLRKAVELLDGATEESGS